MKKFLLWLALLLALTLAGCQKAAEPQTSQEPAELQVLPLAEALELPEQALSLNSAYFLPGGDCLLYGDYALPEGRQGLLFRLTAGAGAELSADSVQQLCIWPEREFFAYTDYLQAYFLARPGVCVLSNQTQHRFLLYDAASGGVQEAAMPAQLNLTPEDQAFWLAEGQYLLLRLQVDPKEPQRVATQISLYNETVGTEQMLTELSGEVVRCLPPDEEHENWLLLTGWGDLLELSLPSAGQTQVRRLNCSEQWPAPQPWLYYNDMQRVRQADGDYLALQVCCEDGFYYQVVDLQGEELGSCPSEDENGGGLLAAQGSKLYFSAYYVYFSANNAQPGDFCRVFAWDFAGGERQLLLGTAAAGLQAYDQWGLGSGALRPDGKELLLFSWGNVVALPLAE